MGCTKVGERVRWQWKIKRGDFVIPNVTRLTSWLAKPYTLNTETDMTVLKHGVVARLLLAAFAGVWINQIAAHLVRDIATQNAIASITQIASIAFIVSAVISIGWMRISFDAETVRSYIPFITNRTVQWSEVTAYRDSFPSHALFANENLVLQIPAMLPRLDILWSECKARGITRR